MVDENRSLSSGMSLPQWMKNKMNDRLNFDHGALSPPENDDNFFYIKYNKTPVNVSNGQLTPKIEIVSNAPSTAPDTNIKTDFSKHTAPCKQFISETSNTPFVVKNASMKVKSSGADDGFKGEGAACGSSVIRVAHQMVSGKLTRGFSTEEEDVATPPPGFNPSLRRGSKSLPSSPLTSPNTSPKSKRRLPNRYFTGGSVTPDKIQGSWILSGLLRKNDFLSRSVSVINEEPSETLHKTISEISIDDAPDSAPPMQKSKVKVKPSGLREMNFWSPTSM